MCNALIDAKYDIVNGKVITKIKRKFDIIEDSSFLPYFYLIPNSDIENTKKNIEVIDVDGHKPRVEIVEKFVGREKRKILKIIVDNPALVPKFRELVKPFGHRYEADIPFIRRYMIDHDLEQFREITDDFKKGKCEIEPKIIAFDIETLSTTKGIEIGKDPIIVISLFGENFAKIITWAEMEGEYVVKVRNERELIEKFIEIIKKEKPEILVGYNSDSFDWPYIKARANKYGIELSFVENEKMVFVRRGYNSVPYIFGIETIDLYLFIRNIFGAYLKSETLSLDAVANEILGEKKIAIGGAEGITKAARENTALLYEYSLQDAKITYHLAQEILPMILQLSKIVGLLSFDVSRFSPSQIVEWLLIKEAFIENILVPNKPKEEEIMQRRKDRFEGAFVKEPIRGLHEKIAVCDFRSLYPTIIIAHNVSPETAMCEHEECKEKNKAPNGMWFCTKKEGFLPKILKRLFEERIKLKKKLKTLDKGGREYKLVDAKQKALKLILNSFYGYLGFPGARWYAVEAASAVTSWGREYIKKIMEEAKEKGFIVVYGDTDSIMITSENKNNFEERVLKFLKEINSKLPNPMELELEDFYVRGIFVTKKRYALLGKNGNLVIKGLEKVRRDWCNLAKNAQETVIKYILDNNVEGAEIYVKNLIKKLKNKEIPLEDLIIKTQLTKDIEKYETIAPHVKVAKDLRSMGKRIFPGMIIEYIVQPGNGNISDKAIAAELAKDYDPEYYIQNQLMPAVKRILDAAKEKDKAKQSSLNRFF